MLCLQSRTSRTAGRVFECFMILVRLGGGFLICFSLLAYSMAVTAAENGHNDTSASVGGPFSWPAIHRECRPWAYWWWLGSAVDTNNLARELTRYRDAGMGGVHIIPIYGAKGYEDKYISYLSPKWMEMLSFTVSEAHRLGLGVDMTTGTGWCFGGPQVTDREANALVVAMTFESAGGSKIMEKLERGATQALMAFSTEGKCIDLTDRIRPDGTVDWTAPEGAWRIYAISQKPSGRMVKRAAPGGAGNMLNLIYPEAMRHYLQRFSAAFDHYAGPKPRAQYHDSYEYVSDWAPDFFSQFEKRRGYRLQTELPALFGKETDDHAARVKCDYRETVSDVMVEESLPLWVKWSHAHGFLTRNQAHGSPGNLLDLYAVADIPETEMFNKDRNKLVSKFASSAAHVSGKNLVASETGTWLKEHFTATLADMKYLLDDVFLSGVNHVIYHGTCYSPDEVAWPGWLFYASTEMNPRNSIWHDVPALNTYIARCESILQSGRPDNDILLYWPIYDIWQQSGDPLLPHFTVHSRGWFEAQAIGKTAERLWNSGYAFDYVSDRQLARMKAGKAGAIETAGSSYRVILVPACDYMPLPTLQKMIFLARNGATIVFESHFPNDVPGLHDLERRRAEFKSLLGQLKPDEVGPGLREAKIGRGRVLIGELRAALYAAGTKREPMFDRAGLMCIRRTFNGGWHYFVANRGEHPIEGWIPLAVPARSVVLMDALTGRTGLGAIRPGHGGNTEVYLQLDPGVSIILRVLSKRPARGEPWPYWHSTNFTGEIAGEWRVDFLSGGPALPPSIETNRLGSWTELGGAEAQRYAGTARYFITFDEPVSSARAWLLDLGKVCQSARVRLNGRELGTLVTPPFRVLVKDLKPKDNLLEVEVTNVSANRIRDLDRRGVKWKNFHDINFVNKDYKPFDASNWPTYDSGLLGPVTLTALVPDWKPR
jgi:alpha-L-rhamnosidase